MKFPTQRHKYCEISHCNTCLEDCSCLADYLETQSGIDRIDHLGSYRTWLDKQGIESESEFGWPLPVAFERANIEGYLEKYKEE